MVGSFSTSAHLGELSGVAVGHGEPPGYSFMSLGQVESWDCNFLSCGQGKCGEGLEEHALSGACGVGLLASLQTTCGMT